MRILKSTSGRTEAEVVAEAAPLFQAALPLLEAVRGPDHVETLLCVRDLAKCLAVQGKIEEAEPLARFALAGFERSLGAEDQDTLLCVDTLQRCLAAKGAFRGEPLLRLTL